MKTKNDPREEVLRKTRAGAGGVPMRVVLLLRLWTDGVRKDTNVCLCVCSGCRKKSKTKPK